jgi:hypothetical protein
MLKTIVMALSIAILSGADQSTRPGPITMQELTVPAERLPTGCVRRHRPSRRHQSSLAELGRSPDSEQPLGRHGQALGRVDS